MSSSVGSSSSQREPIAGHCQVAIERVEEPERRVGGVVERRPLAFGKQVGDQPVADVVGERAEDVAGLGVPAGGQRQAFEADHGVAAPVGEPVIAGDHGADFVAGGVARAASATRVVGVMMN